MPDLKTLIMGLEDVRDNISPNVIIDNDIIRLQNIIMELKTLEAQTIGQAEVQVMQGVSQPVFACAADRDLFIKNAGTWMDVDTFCETVNERDETRICNNCFHWDKRTKSCNDDDLFGCIELISSPYSDGTFGCRKFASKQTA